MERRNVKITVIDGGKFVEVCTYIVSKLRHGTFRLRFTTLNISSVG